MAESKNIKELPQSDAMGSGDYFLIETPAGTQLLDFENFVIDQDNTTFAAELQTNVTTLSTAMTSVSASVDITNEDSSIYILNTSLTESINGVTNSLYGETFETTLNNFIAAANTVSGPEGETRSEMSHFEALSAMVYDELHSRVNSISSDIFGAGVKITDEAFPYTLIHDSIQGKQTPSQNLGGLLGVILKTAINSVDVFTGEVTATFKNSTGDSATLSLSNVPQRYNVTAGSLQYNIHFSNPDNIGATDPDPNPYSDPGQFVITNFTSTPGVVSEFGTGTYTYSWTIKRIGGTSVDNDSFPITLYGRVVAGVNIDTPEVAEEI